MRRFLVLMLALLPAMARGQSLPSPSYNGANIQVTTPGSTTARTLPARFAERLNVMDFGATGDGTTDDSAAVALAITRANTLASSAVRSVIYFPIGTYRIAATPLPAFARAGSIVGDGRRKSFIKIDPSYSGDLFSWSESWAGTSLSNTINFSTLATGILVADIGIVGDLTSTNQQNALMFWDRTDSARVRDVDLFYIPGRAIYAGGLKNQVQGWLRETQLSNIRAFNIGLAGVPGVEITSSCTTCAGMDGSNEVTISDFSIYNPVGPGFVIRNGTGAGTLRQFRISKLRVEGKEGATSTGDLLQIGDATMDGAISTLTISDSEFASPKTGYSAVRVMAASSSNVPSDIAISGQILTGAGGGGGLRVDAGSRIKTRWNNMGGTPNVTVGATPLVAGTIVVDGGGAEQYYSYSIDSTATRYVRGPVFRYGDLSASASLSAQAPDSGTTGGNARGANAVDLQSIRSGAAQVASGQTSTIGGGTSNTAAAQETVVAGGWTNTAGAFRATVGGGGGNTASGNYATIPGGLQASALGNFGMMAFASGQFAAAGDSQIGWHVLHRSTSATTAVRLTTDGFSASSSTGNSLVPASNSAWLIDLDCVYRDTVSAAVATWGWKGILLTRGANAASTAVAAPTATAGQTNGTPGASAPVIAADTTLGSLSVTFTPPNTDASHTVCRAASTIVQ